ncbi:MAG: aryl-sulfate sulfotransferase, partial [bacterium]
ELLPSGNILVIAWEYKSFSECISAGRDPSTLSDGELWPDMIIEVEPIYPDSGRIVWEWHAWDHIIQDFDSTKPNYGNVSENPGKIDINYFAGLSGNADWLHLNAVDYNPVLDQIILSNHNFSELWIIDHGTTTLEATDSAGDLLYRWGNPATYGRGGPFDQQLFAQHDAQWIVSGLPGAGDILVFSNGRNNPPPLRHSEIVQITPPVDDFGVYSIVPDSAYAPISPFWTYSATPETSWFAQNISGCQRLPNGNTLICSGPQGWFFEVTEDGTIVWEYINPVNNAGPQIQGTIIDRNEVFRCYRYSSDYPGLIGRDLTPGEVIELTDTTGIGFLN